MAAPADFSAQQFAKDSVAEKVLEQYDDEKTRLFYQITMGGGGHDIHYGLFRSEEDGVRESSANSTAFMMSCMDWARPVRCAPRRRAPLHVRRMQSPGGADSCSAAAYCCSAARAGDGGEPRPGSGLGPRRLRARAGAALRLPRAGASPAPRAFPATRAAQRTAPRPAPPLATPRLTRAMRSASTSARSRTR